MERTHPDKITTGINIVAQATHTVYQLLRDCNMSA